MMPLTVALTPKPAVPDAGARFAGAAPDRDGQAPVQSPFGAVLAKLDTPPAPADPLASTFAPPRFKEDRPKPDATDTAAPPASGVDAMAMLAAAAPQASWAASVRAPVPSDQAARPKSAAPTVAGATNPSAPALSLNQPNHPEPQAPTEAAPSDHATTAASLDGALPTPVSTTAPAPKPGPAARRSERPLSPPEASPKPAGESAAKQRLVDPEPPQDPDRRKLDASVITDSKTETHFPPVGVGAPLTMAGQVAAAVTTAVSDTPPAPATAGPPSTTQETPPVMRVLTVELQPKELGVVEVRMRLVGGRLDLQVEARRPETARLLEKDKTALVTALQGSGYGVDGLTIRVADTTAGQGAAGGQSGGQASSGSSPGGGQAAFDDRASGQRGNPSSASGRQPGSQRHDAPESPRPAERRGAVYW